MRSQPKLASPVPSMIREKTVFAIAIALIAVAGLAFANSDAGAQEPVTPPADEAAEVASSSVTQRLAGRWRVNLDSVMREYVSSRSSRGVGVFAAGASRFLFGESYGLVDVAADGTGSATGMLLGDTAAGAGTWQVVEEDGDRATIRVVVPAENIDRNFDIRMYGDYFTSEYRGHRVTFYRQ